MTQGESQTGDQKMLMLNSPWLTQTWNNLLPNCLVPLHSKFPFSSTFCLSSLCNPGPWENAFKKAFPGNEASTNSTNVVIWQHQVSRKSAVLIFENQGHIQVCPWLDQEHKLNKNNQEHQVCAASSKVMRNPSKLITSPWQLGPTPSQRPPSNARKLAVITQFVVPSWVLRLAAPVVVALLACCLPAVLGCCCSLQWELAQNGETEVKCSMNRS